MRVPMPRLLLMSWESRFVSRAGGEARGAVSTRLFTIQVLTCVAHSGETSSARPEPHEPGEAGVSRLPTEVVHHLPGSEGVCAIPQIARYIVWLRVFSLWVTAFITPLRVGFHQVGTPQHHRKPGKTKADVSAPCATGRQAGDGANLRLAGVSAGLRSRLGLRGALLHCLHRASGLRGASRCESGAREHRGGQLAGHLPALPEYRLSHPPAGGGARGLGAELPRAYEVRIRRFCAATTSPTFNHT
eukprot:scaffold317_cov260-Pinguiococcus_pyrenoidosus.AAC.56